jgi:hypothetical protein
MLNYSVWLTAKTTMGLFKNAQRQGTQKPYREAYIYIC